MKGIFSVMAFCVFALVACAQTKSVITQSHAFYVVRLPGNIAVDDNGNPLHNTIDTLNIIYVETRTQNLVWNEAQKEGISYAVQATLINDNVLVAGVNKNTQEPVVLKTTDSNHLWRLVLVRKENKFQNDGNKNPGPFIIEGKNGDQKFSFTIKKTQELLLPDQAQ